MMSMNEVKESLRGVEQKYRLFQQQQFTFIAALEHCRENAHDKIRPISSIGQVVPGGACVRGLGSSRHTLGAHPAQSFTGKTKQRPGAGACWCHSPDSDPQREPILHASLSSMWTVQPLKQELKTQPGSKCPAPLRAGAGSLYH